MGSTGRLTLVGSTQGLRGVSIRLQMGAALAGSLSQSRVVGRVGLGQVVLRNLVLCACCDVGGANGNCSLGDLITAINAMPIIRHS